MKNENEPNIARLGGERDHGGKSFRPTEGHEQIDIPVALADMLSAVHAAAARIQSSHEAITPAAVLPWRITVTRVLASRR